MANLVQIFGPITGNTPDLSKIGLVAFDIFGTLIDHHGQSKERTTLFAQFLLHEKIVDLAFISTQPDKAEKALTVAGCRIFTIGNGVQLKPAFYKNARDRGIKILAIDDDEEAASNALIYLDPNAENIQKYLDAKAYRYPELYKR